MGEPRLQFRREAATVWENHDRPHYTLKGIGCVTLYVLLWITAALAGRYWLSAVWLLARLWLACA